VKIARNENLKLFFIHGRVIGTVTGFMSERLSGANSERTCCNKVNANVNVKLRSAIIQ